MPNPSELERADPRGEPLSDAEEVERLRAKNRELNRRWQEADRAYRQAWEALSKGWTWRGGSFGRALLAYTVQQLEQKLAASEADRARERAAFAVHWQGLLRAREADLRAAHEHAAALAADVERLQRLNEGLCAQVAAASEVLARRAEKDPDKEALRALLGRARAALESVRPWDQRSQGSMYLCDAGLVREVLGAMERAGV